MTVQLMLLFFRDGDFMITQNELNDLSFCITLIRNDIKSKENIFIINVLLGILGKYDSLIENNEIRKSLCKIPGLADKWVFIRYENYYVKTIIDNYKSQKLLYDMLLSLKLLLEDEKIDQAFDLADTMHVLPDIIADNEGGIPKSFFKIFAKPYEKKWKVKIGED